MSVKRSISNREGVLDARWDGIRDQADPHRSREAARSGSGTVAALWPVVRCRVVVLGGPNGDGR